MGILLPLPAIVLVMLAAPLYALLMAVPTFMAVMGGAVRLRSLQMFGVAGMALVSAVWLALAVVSYASDTGNALMMNGLGKTFSFIFLGLSLAMGLGAYLMRHPEWRVAPRNFDP